MGRRANPDIEGFRVRLRYVDSFRDRHGVWRYYFRRRQTGDVAIALPNPIDPIAPSEAFMTAYRACLNGKPMTSTRVLTGGVIYAVGAGHYVKIGYTIDLNKRLRTLSTASPVPLKVLKRLRGTPADERRLHAMFKPWKQKNEWFRLEGDVAEWVKS